MADPRPRDENPPADPHIPRRRLLQTAAASPALLAVSSTPNPVAAQAKPQPDSLTENPVIVENRKAGDAGWQLNRVRINQGKFRTSLIEGYCSQQSVAAGETLQLMLSAEPARRATVDIYRLGYYGGLGARRVQSFGPLEVETQPTPSLGPDPARLRECQWRPTLELKIPDDWLSGVYLGKLTTVPESRSEPYWQSYVIFIVKDARPAELLFQCSDNTWQAYNRWPENESLYTHPDGAHAPDVAVSFDRPYGMYTQIFEHPLSIGSGEFLLWEYPLCYWLEQHGYDVTYGANRDLLNAQFVTRCRTFISVGHDEYWDVRQYRSVETAINNGTNALWLCGNSVFIDSPFRDSSDGRAERIISRRGCYGELREDEIESYSRLFAGLNSTGPDERRLIGARSVVPFNGGGDWTCRQPDHWVFTGTGMRQGDSIPGLVGWEHHGEPDPERAGLEVLASGSVWAGGVREGKYAATIFPGPRDNLVFNAATIFWSQGLASPPGHMIPWSHWSRPSGPDPRVQQITHNVLQRCRKRPPL